MNHRTIATAILTTSLALAACHQPPSMPTQPFVAQGITMKLDPPAAPDCKPSTTYRAILTWSTDSTDSPKTDVRLDSLDGKLFARSNDQKAHAETGDWVHPGMWFLLFDRRSGDLLGALQAGPKPCP
jgi:hypothetical protein